MESMSILRVPFQSVLPQHCLQDEWCLLSEMFTNGERRRVPARGEQESRCRPMPRRNIRQKQAESERSRK